MPEFNALLENEIPKLRRYARALTRNTVSADDLVQDCLLRAIRKSHLWQPGTDLRAWLFTMLHNQYVNDVRAAARRGVTVNDDQLDGLDTPATQSAPLLMRDLDRAIKRLPEEQRQVLLLVGLEAFSYEEAARILNIPVGTVRSRLSRGREALRGLMGEPPQRSAAA